MNIPLLWRSVENSKNFDGLVPGCSLDLTYSYLIATPSPAFGRIHPSEEGNCG